MTPLLDELVKAMETALAQLNEHAEARGPLPTYEQLAQGMRLAGRCEGLSHAVDLARLLTG